MLGDNVIGRRDLVLRQADDLDPVVGHRLHRPHQIVERDRFGNKRAGAEIVGPGDVFLGRRSREYDDRDTLEV